MKTEQQINDQIASLDDAEAQGIANAANVDPVAFSTTIDIAQAALNWVLADDDAALQLPVMPAAPPPAA